MDQLRLNALRVKASNWKSNFLFLRRVVRARASNEVKLLRHAVHAVTRAVLAPVRFRFGKMPSIFSHAVCATALGAVYAPKRMPVRFWVLTVICSILPDADVVGFAFGVRYGDVLGHRGITHSLVFALVASWLVVLLAFREHTEGKAKISLFVYFFAVTVSHPLLDALTNGGLGVALFAPFDASRYFLPSRPIEVSPIGAGFFSARGLSVLISEIKWVWLPSLAVMLIRPLAKVK